MTKLLSLNQVCDITSLSRTAVNKHRAAGTFPKEVVISEKRIAFVEAEINDWIEARVNARDERASA